MGPNGSGFWAGERDGLVGRDATLAELRELLETGARTAVVTGIPGAGKTSVLTVVTRAEAADGRLVLPLTCHRSERDLAFGVLVDLLTAGPDAAGVLDLVLPDPTRPTAVDPLRLRLEVLAWLERIGEERPVLVVLDDSQWCDDSSLSVLGFVARRLAGSQASLLAAARGDSAPEALSRSPEVPLRPLGRHDATALLRQAGVHLDSLALPSVIDRAAGNPLALIELGRAAAGEGDHLAPSSVETGFADQIALLPEATRELLLLAAAGDGDLKALARTVDPSALLDGLVPAERAGLVAVADDTVRFRHPLVRSAAYALAPAASRTAAHVRLAEAYADDAERRAWHRAQATVVPDSEVAADLVAASELAVRRGASAEAARLLVRAADLSTDETTREERLLRAMMINNTAGNFDWAARTGMQLRSESQDPAIRIRAAHIAAYSLAQTERSSAARRALLQVLEELQDVEPSWGWSSLTTLAVLTYRSGWDVADVAHWLAEYDRVQALAPNPMPDLVEASRAWIRVQIDPTVRPPELVALVRDAPVPDYPAELAGTHEMLLGAAAWLLDEPGTALERLSRSIDMKRRADQPGEMTQTLIALALVQVAVGDYDAAEQSSRLVVDIAEARNQSYAVIDGHELRSRVAALRGDTDLARELCDRVLLEIPAGESLALEVTVRVTLSWVRLAEHDPAGAWNEVRRIFDDDGEPRHLHICYRELGTYAAAAVRAGDLDVLAQVLTVAERRLTDPGPYHAFQLDRVRALVAGEDAEPWHLAAVHHAPAAQWPFELANAQLEYGAWLRRRHRATDARLQLQAAFDTFERLGARPWADLARGELRAAGVATGAPTRSAWAGLTGQEREVVRLAAAGKTNPEIAAALYLSPRTVSTHLYNAFPKLGVTARAQLRDVVPGPT